MALLTQSQQPRNQFAPITTDPEEDYTFKPIDWRKSITPYTSNISSKGTGTGTGVVTIGGGTGTTGTPATTDPNAPINIIPPSGTSTEPSEEPITTTPPPVEDPNAPLGTGQPSGSASTEGTVNVGELEVPSMGDIPAPIVPVGDPNAPLGTGQPSGSASTEGTVNVGALEVPAWGDIPAPIAPVGDVSAPLGTGQPSGSARTEGTVTVGPLEVSGWDNIGNSVNISGTQYTPDDPLYTLAKVSPWILEGKTPAELAALRAKEQAKRDAAIRNATPNPIITAPTHPTAWGTVSSEPLYGTGQFPTLNPDKTFMDMAEIRANIGKLIDRVPVLGQVDDAYNYIAENYHKGPEWFDQNLFNGAGKIVEDLGRIFIPYGNQIAMMTGASNYEADPNDPWYLKGLIKANNVLRNTPIFGGPISLIEDMGRAAYFGIENIFDPNNLDKMALIRKSQDEGDYATAQQIADQIAAEGATIGEGIPSDEGLDTPIIPDIQVDEQGNLVEPLEEVNTTAALPNIDYSAIEFTPEELSVFDKYRLNPDDPEQISQFLSQGNINSAVTDILDRYRNAAGPATSGAGVGTFGDPLNLRGQVTGDLGGDIGYVPHNPGSPDTAGQLAYGVPVAPFDLLREFSNDVSTLTEAQKKAEVRSDLGTQDEVAATEPSSWTGSQTWEDRMQDYANRELANVEPIMPEIPEPEIPEISVAYDPFTTIGTGKIIGALEGLASQQTLMDLAKFKDVDTENAKQAEHIYDIASRLASELYFPQYLLGKTVLEKVPDPVRNSYTLQPKVLKTIEDVIKTMMNNPDSVDQAIRQADNEILYAQSDTGQWQPGWGQWDVGESGMYDPNYGMAGWIPSTLTGVEFQPKFTVSTGPLEVVQKASGGEIESYREGGIAGLADGEFVIPADVVSGLGNGSTKAGARKIYEFLGESPIDPFGEGGETGYYKVGGQLLDGPGDGMSDSIPAMITGNEPQPAALADGEFVVSNDQVARIGGGSTKVGARKLYQLMDNVRQDRTGTTKQAPQINANKHLNRLVRGR